jgi:hypothetical protein
MRKLTYRLINNAISFGLYGVKLPTHSMVGLIKNRWIEKNILAKGG